MIARAHSPLLWLTAFTLALAGHAAIALSFASSASPGGGVPSASTHGQPLAISLAASGASRERWQAAQPVAPAVAAPMQRKAATAVAPPAKPPQTTPPRVTTVKPAVPKPPARQRPQQHPAVAPKAASQSATAVAQATPSAATAVATTGAAGQGSAGMPAATQSAITGGPGTGTGTGTGTSHIATTGVDDDDAQRRARQHYFAQLSAWLKRHQEYPEALKQARQQGTVVVRFTLDRQGKLLASSIKQSSGHSQLDQAALALLVSASPLPPLPDELPQQRVTLSVPIDYSLTTALVASRSTP